MGAKTEPKIATNNSALTFGTVAFTAVNLTQSQPPISNNHIITSIIGATTEAKNKRTRKTESSNDITSDITSNKNTSYTIIATNANPAPKRKKKSKEPTNGHTNNVVKKAMPDIGHPFFVLERIRATKLAGERRASNNINRNSMLNSLNINDSQSQSNLTAFPQAPQSATPQAPVMYLPSFLGPPPPLQPPQYPPTPASTAATASSLSSSLTRRPKFVHTSTLRGANGMPLASTLLTAPTLFHVPSDTAPTPVLGQAQLPSAIPPTTTADASLVVDLTEDDDAQAIEPYTPPASDRIGNLVEQLQRNLEEKQEEMSMWCEKMTQLMMDAPNLIKAAGQVYGGEAETRALNAAEALSEYGRTTLGSCFDACDNVWKIFKDVDGAQTTAITTSAASAAFSTTTIGAADRSR